jgi:hypothetical protein
MAPRDRNFLQFVPPNLRPALSEAGRVGYNILDNIIGYDDGYDTTGELLARSLREDPLGTLGSLAGGLYEGVRTAVTEPVQTARNVADEFSEAFLRLREPLPEFASREDIAQRTSDLSILGAIVPTVGPTLKTVGTAGQLAARAVPGRRDYDPFDDQDLINELIDNMDTDLIDSVGVDPAVAVDPAPAVDPPADYLDDIVFGQAMTPVLDASTRRAAFVAALGGEASYQDALRGFFDMDPADYDEAANNLSNFTVLERTVFDPEDGPQPDQYTVGMLAAMDPDAVRALAAQIENDPTGSVYSPELVDMLADMTPQELEEITGLPIAGAGTGFQQTPFDPNDIDFGPDMDQIAAGGTNPWTNVQGAEDLAANYLPAPPPQIDLDPTDQVILNALQNAPPFTAATDPFRGLPGTRALNETAPAAALPEANPYMPTNQDFQIPQTWMNQGIAGVYSRSGRAADRLGQPQYTDIEALRRELEKHGAAPGELRYQLDQFEEAMLDGPLSREDIQRFFSDKDTGLSIDRSIEFAGGWMPRGGRNATSTVYYHPAGQNYPPAAKRHFEDVGNPFDDNTKVPLFHSRAAQYDLGFPGGGTTHHVAEIQSDFGQYRQTLPTTPEQRFEMSSRVGELMGKLNARVALTPAERGELDRLQDALRSDRLLDEFDEDFDAPYVRRENDWVDAAVRQNLLDAVNSGSDWITFGNGQQAHTHSKMPLEAAKSFYDTRVPRRIGDVLRRFANQAGIEAPSLETVPFVDGSDVRGFRITPEFREALLRTGLPSYRFGGIVSLMRK